MLEPSSRKALQRLKTAFIVAFTLSAIAVLPAKANQVNEDPGRQPITLPYVLLSGLVIYGSAATAGLFYLRRQLQSAKESHIALQAENHKLRLTNNDLYDDSQSLKRSKAELQAEYKNLQQEKGVLQSNVSDLQNQIETHQQNIQSLEQQVLQHEAHSQEATNQLSEERKIVALLREEKDCQTQSIKVLEQELQSKEAKLNEKDQELQQIYDECCQLDQKNQSLEADHRRLSQLYEHQNQKYLSDKEWLTHEHSRLETNLREYIRKIQKLQAQAKSKRHRRKQLQFKSVEQMLLTAQKNFPILDVWHDAEKSAQAERRRQYNFEKIYRALSAIAAIGKEYFECKNCGIALGPLQEAFERHGVSNYRRNETEKTMTFYGNERKFYSGNGRCSVMEQHLTFTAKGSEGALQIFFEFDDERQKVNIGYCGKHLPYAKQNS